MAAATALASDTLDLHLVTLFEKLEDLRRDQLTVRLLPAKAELRSLEFWRSIISECLSSFFYVFTVSGAAAGVASGGSTAETILAASFAAGFSIAALTQSFGHVSGAHVNPAVSIAMALTRHVTLLRGIMFVIAQCGGGIAGAALLYGVTVPGRQGTLPAAAAQLPPHLLPWERFGLELILTFVVVFTYFVSMDSHRRWLGGTSLAIGSAYLAASIVSMPFLNPARALGLAFVLNRWENHWVYWFGPIIGGLMAGLIYEFIFNPRRHFKRSKDSLDGDSSSIHSDEDTYDELDKPRSAYNTLRPVQPGADLYRPVGNSSSPSGGNQSYCAANMVQGSIYGPAPSGKVDRAEPLYGGTKSLYCKSPPLTRANLNRSQSVYSKTTAPPMLHRNDNGVPRPGPLIPAQSMYPMRLNSNSSANSSVAAAANQNTQNQQRLGTEAIYGTRANGGERIYRKLPGRPESVYGQRQEPSDGVYQYQSPPAPRGAANYAPVPKPVPAYLPMQPQQRQEEAGIPAQGPPPYMRNEHRESPNPQQQQQLQQQQKQLQQQQQQLQQQQQQQSHPSSHQQSHPSSHQQPPHSQAHQPSSHQQPQQPQQQQVHQQKFRESPPQQFRESPSQQPQQYRESPNPQYRESPPNPQYVHRQEQQARDSPSQQY